MTADDWPQRQRQWQRKLGRLRLNAEPLDEQLDRHRRVTWALTVVPGIIGLMFLALFSAFHAPGLGLLVVGILLAPIILFAWLSHLRLARRVRAFEKERREALGTP